MAEDEFLRYLVKVFVVVLVHIHELAECLHVLGELHAPKPPHVLIKNLLAPYPKVLKVFADFLFDILSFGVKDRHVKFREEVLFAADEILLTHIAEPVKQCHASVLSVNFWLRQNPHGIFVLPIKVLHKLE